MAEHSCWQTQDCVVDNSDKTNVPAVDSKAVASPRNENSKRVRIDEFK